MSLPDWVQATRQTVVVSAPSVDPSFHDEVTELERRLDFTIQARIHTQWCWAAVSVGVARFYRADSPWKQCAVVAAVRGDTSCCEDGGSAACNVPEGLGKALSTVRHLSGKVREGVLDLTSGIAGTSVKDQIDQRRPVGARVRNGGGHFVVLHGYDLTDGEQWIDVADPTLGEPTYSTYDYRRFAKGFHGGEWTHSYLTAP